MEVYRANELSNKEIEKLRQEGCYIEPFTISREKGEQVEDCLYVVHPARSIGGRDGT